jgi:hypothetical protein
LRLGLVAADEVAAAPRLAVGAWASLRASAIAALLCANAWSE